jgi:hypothetical protein
MLARAGINNKTGGRFVKGSRLVGFVLIVIFLLGGAVSALADGPEFPMTPETAQEALEEGERAEAQLTDPKAAEQFPHSDLERAEVLQLISAVFGTQIEGVAGVFSDLDVDHFLSDNAAVIAAGDQPEASGVVIGAGDYDGPALLESTVPLRTEAQGGEQATVDLGLEHAEGEIQPATPLVEVGIPSELGQGIELPESEVGISLAGAPEERAPSIVDQTVAVYPEVAEDTSFAVAPSPTGVETFTLLQSPDAPNSSTYQLSLPEGASLSASDDGGAEVVTGEQPMLRIFPPAAMDAEGNNVPVGLEVSGSSFTVHAEPPQGAAYPILVDPVVESYNWYGTKTSTNLGDWTGSSNNIGLLYNKQSALGLPGTDLRAVKGFNLPYNAKAHWAYSVPRYESDIKNFEAPPTSYISKMVTTNVFFIAGADNSLYPMMAAGIWDTSQNNWASAWGHGGNTGNIENMATTYTFSTTNQNAKQAIDNELWAGEAHTMTWDRETYVGNATIELADQVAPKIGSFVPPEGWVNETVPGIPFAMTDTGLGVYEIAAGELTKSGGKVWTTKQGCIGIVSSPCPRTWSEDGKTSWLKLLKPSELPQGINKLQVVARDPVNNSSAPYEFSLKVDHTAPGVALSGTMTEQASLGAQRPSYILTTTNKDGTEAAPQSGVASTEITVDGKKVDSSAAGCVTQNCSVTRSWTLESNAYSVGKHVVVAKATDAVGLTTEKTLNIEIQRDTIAPTVYSTTGGLENAPSGWVEQKSYKLGVGAEDAGYGVTSLEFKMDGKVVKSTTASCPKGACALGMWEVSVSMAGYAGGAHTAEYVAKDGAGNVTKKTWTVNIDPSGVVSAAEAVDTLEAIEETTEASPVAPSEELIDPAEVEEGNNPALTASEGELTSTGTGATTTMTTDPSDGLTIEGAEGSVAITPIGGTGETASEVVSDVAAVSGGSGVDTVTRPSYDGGQTFKMIRDESAPEAYSWKVSLNKGQTLKAIDSEHAAIFYSDESQALAITAEAAHDATGKGVPTSLSVSEGNVLTLTIKYKGKGFVYPILAGPAFQSSYTLPVIWEPAPPPKESPEETLYLVHGMSYYLTIGAPQFVGCPEAGEACASSGAPIGKYGVAACSPSLVWPCDVWEEHMRGFYYYNGLQAWMSKRQPQCTPKAGPTFSINENYCKWVGPDHQPYGNGYHITSQAKWEVTGDQGITNTTSTKYMTVRMFGSGHAYAHPTSDICNPSRPDC